MTQVILQGSKLYKIGHASHSAEVTMTDLALRERVRDFSDITRTKTKLIRDGEKIVDADYIAFWKSLQAEGIGSIIYGRKGRPDKFEWHYSLKKVAKAALEGVDIKVDKQDKLVDVKPGLKTQVESAPTQAKPVQERINSSKILYIPLRKNFNLELNLPGDISKDELSLIANALETISA